MEFKNFFTENYWLTMVDISVSENETFCKLQLQ